MARFCLSMLAFLVSGRIRRSRLAMNTTCLPGNFFYSSRSAASVTSPPARRAMTGTPDSVLELFIALAFDPCPLADVLVG